jgi:hypothetical protein
MPTPLTNTLISATHLASVYTGIHILNFTYLPFLGFIFIIGGTLASASIYNALHSTDWNRDKKHESTRDFILRILAYIFSIASIVLIYNEFGFIRLLGVFGLAILLAFVLIIVTGVGVVMTLMA